MLCAWAQLKFKDTPNVVSLIMDLQAYSQQQLWHNVVATKVENSRYNNFKPNAGKFYLWLRMKHWSNTALFYNKINKKP